MNSERISVVFDTNIYISSVVFGGKPGDIYLIALNGEIDLYISTLIKKEVKDCLQLKFNWETEKVHDYIEQISRVTHLMETDNTLQGVCRDPEDDHVLSLATTANADYIVSGDKDLLTLKVFNGIKILNAASFLRLLSNI